MYIISYTNEKKASIKGISQKQHALQSVAIYFT